ncbi:MAG: complex I subunit 5 family protein [Xanthomonadaceae bacterium]|nr:complex I subunit 5 family protein [Xanthomonadaceae bacterium]
MTSLIALALLLPLLALAVLRRPRLLRPALVLAPLPLAALAWVGQGSLSLPAMLFGTGYAVDPDTRPFLLLAGVGWSLAGAYAGRRLGPGLPRFAAFWLLTLAGQAGALLAADIAAFYTGYVLMTLAAYGLVVHSGESRARHAGRVYLTLAFIGEAMVLSGLLLLGARHGNVEFVRLAESLSSADGPASLLLVAGFAVKLGIFPLHVWLPLAHPVAPVPASAVLSGVIVKTGLLGMMRLAPAGGADFDVALAWLGLFTAFYGALAGLGQARLKTVLAYSTISQAGLLLIAFAVWRQAPGTAAASVLGVFVLHHGLNKIALFLAAGGTVGAGWLRGILFALPALALVGVPFSSGALAKSELKRALAEVGWDGVTAGLGLASVATFLLLAHAWRLARQDRERVCPIHVAWPLAVLAGALLPWLWAVGTGEPIGLRTVDVWQGVWPVLVGAVLLALKWRVSPGRWPNVPEGDLLVWAVSLYAVVLRAWRCLRWPALHPLSVRPLRLPDPGPALARLPVIGLGLLLVVAVLFWRLHGP